MTGHGKESGADELRKGWTTGACATAAVQAALHALWGGGFPQRVTITLPKGETPTFPLAHQEQTADWVEVGITKDAGDDPDVTHGALIIARVEEFGSGISFAAGEGVGIVTKDGLPIAVGEPAINPVPRKMITGEIERLAVQYGKDTNIKVTISIPGGEEIALKTWNPRLGIKGGLSILGTTGIVRPFSCAAWIASIHRGVDVARATGAKHVAGCTGSTSEATVQSLYGLNESDMLDMGDFVGGLLKYLRKHPVERITIGGGIGKMVKLAQGAVDLHSGRSQVDFARLETLAIENGCAPYGEVNTALEAYTKAGPKLAAAVAKAALEQIHIQLRANEINVDVVVIDRAGTIIGQAK
jgi:cobalt-precorrin-5B (C1)-methyltransferase